jgi:hypothetical protein
MELLLNKILVNFCLLISPISKYVRCNITHAYKIGFARCIVFAVQSVTPRTLIWLVDVSLSPSLWQSRPEKLARYIESRPGPHKPCLLMYFWHILEREALLLCVQDISHSNIGYMSEISDNFAKSLPVNARIMPQTRPWPSPLIEFAMHYSWHEIWNCCNVQIQSYCVLGRGTLFFDS